MWPQSSTLRLARRGGVQPRDRVAVDVGRDFGAEPLGLRAPGPRRLDLKVRRPGRFEQPQQEGLGFFAHEAPPTMVEGLKVEGRKSLAIGRQEYSSRAAMPTLPRCALSAKMAVVDHGPSTFDL